MGSDVKVVKNSYTWLVVAGGAAIALGIFLYSVDNSLTFSNSEEVLGETLHELRSAQAEVSPGISDLRQTGGIALTQEIDAHGDDHHSDDAH